MLKSIGGILFVLGAWSTALFFLGHELKVLMRISTRGNDVAWMIRIGMMTVGAILYIIGYVLENHTKNKSSQTPVS